MSDTDTKPAESEGGQPLYIQLAQSLGRRIANGELAVGDLLPTEAELGSTFGVSRYTVRQAILHLRQQGLVSARKGVGTRVEARRTDPSYSQSVHSLTELLQFAHETRLDLIAHEELVARGSLAETLGCRPGKSWIRVVGIRRGEAHEPPICHSEVFIDAAYKNIAKDARSLRTAFWSLIEQQFGETVVEVEQRIEAVLLKAEQAAQLAAAPETPALRFTRRYFVTGRRLVELSVNLHPADRFTYHMTLRRDASAT
jgi:DNA-binding GntR family transcriptional regulator